MKKPKAVQIWISEEVRNLLNDLAGIEGRTQRGSAEAAIRMAYSHAEDNRYRHRKQDERNALAKTSPTL